MGKRGSGRLDMGGFVECAEFTENGVSAVEQIARRRRVAGGVA